MKNREIMECYNALRSLDECTVPMAKTICYARLINLRKLQPCVEEIERIRTDLVYKYGKTDESGSASISPDDAEAIKKFSDEYNELLEYDNSDIVLNKIPLEVVPPELTARDFDALACMIEE